MSKMISCSELGVKDCEFVASGMTVNDVVEEMVEHLREEHDIKMPDAKMILNGDVGVDTPEMADKATELIVNRMIEKLEINPPPDTPEPPEPTIDKLPPR